MATQKGAKAVATYKKAATIAPASPLPKRKLAELFLLQNALDDAAFYIEDLLKSNKDDTAGHYLKGRLALAREHTAEAITALKKVIKEEPHLAAAHYYLGLAYVRNDNTQLAKSAPCRGTQTGPGPTAKLAPRHGPSLFTIQIL